jgi:muconolactone D-isomerase
MLFMARMETRLPHDFDEAVVADLMQREKERVLELQGQGRWLYIWRVAGRRANVSVLDVASVDELHGILSSLPLYPFLDIELTALGTHPASLAANPQ